MCPVCLTAALIAAGLSGGGVVAVKKAFTSSKPVIPPEAGKSSK